VPIGRLPPARAGLLPIRLYCRCRNLAGLNRWGCRTRPFRALPPVRNRAHDSPSPFPEGIQPDSITSGSVLQRAMAQWPTRTKEKDAEAAQTSPLAGSHYPFYRPDHLLLCWSRSLPCIAVRPALCALPSPIPRKRRPPCRDEMSANPPAGQRSRRHPPCRDETCANPPVRQRSRSYAPCRDDMSANPPVGQQSRSYAPCRDEMSANPPVGQRSRRYPPCREQTCANPPAGQQSRRHPPCRDETCANPPARQRSRRYPPCREQTCANPPAGQRSRRHPPCRDET
jgi:hypothetical protein